MFDIFNIFTQLKKKLTKTDLVIIALIIFIFFTTRLINLTDLPIFTDEAIYIHWAKQAWRDASWRFISLTDGRQPLQTWGTIPFLKIFKDPLFAGRMFAVFSGFFALTGISSLVYYLYKNTKLAFLAAFVYIVNPYYLFYERMALVDATVNGFYIWIILLSLILIKNKRLDIAIIFGAIAGLGTLAKSTIRVFLLPPLIAPFIFYLKKKDKVRNIVNYLFLFTIALLIAFVIYNVQRLSPFMHYIEQKNTTFVMSPMDYFSSPFNPLLHNLITVPFYFLSESSYILVLLGIIGLVLMFKNNKELASYLFLFFIVPFLAISALARVIFPRYLIFLTIPFFIGFIHLLKATKYKILLLTVYLLSVVYLNYTILFSPKDIPFPKIDRGQYIEGVTAGWGVNEIVAFLNNKANKEGDIYVFTEGTFGLMPYSLDIYFSYDDPRLHFEPRWPMKDEDLEYAVNLAKNHPVYLVFHERTSFPTNWPLKLIRAYGKPYGNNKIFLFSVKQ